MTPSSSDHELVSVIIPLYNAEPFIAETLKSVLSQTFASFHIYVVDDFSMDKSAQIVHDFIAKYPETISYHAMKEKGGKPSPTKNAGVALAKGLYCAFIDHDDWWDPTKLEKQVAYMESHPEVTLLGCNVAIVDTERNQTLGMFWKDPAAFGSGDKRLSVLEAPIFATTTCLLAKTDYLKTHPFDVSYIGADEYDISVHAVLDNPDQVAILPETLAYWRWHSASLSHSDKAASRAADDEEKFAAKILARSDLKPEEKEIVTNRLWTVRTRHANALIASGKRDEGRALYKQIIKEAPVHSKLVPLMLQLDSLFPPLARLLITLKRRASYAKPAFR